MLNQNLKRYFPSKCSITNTFQCLTATFTEDMNIRNSKVTLKPNQMHLTKGIQIRRAADVTAQLLKCKFALREKRILMKVSKYELMAK